MKHQYRLEGYAFRLGVSVCSRYRVAFYRLWGMHIGTSCRLERIRVRRPSQIELGSHNALSEGCWLWPNDSPSENRRIRIGNHNYFNRDVILDAAELIKIGDQNMFGPRVYVTDSNHIPDASEWVTHTGLSTACVNIGNGCWIGAHAVILKGVHIGDRSIIAAGAIVTQSIPERSLAAGVPARVIKTIS